MLENIIEELRSRVVLDPFKGRGEQRAAATQEQLEHLCSWQDLASKAGIDPAVGPLRAAGLRVSTVFPGMFLASGSTGVQVLTPDEAAELVARSCQPSQDPLQRA